METRIVVPSEVITGVDNTPVPPKVEYVDNRPPPTVTVEERTGVVARGRYTIVKVNNARNMREAFDLAGMGFKVEKVPLFAPNPALNGVMEKVDGAFVTIRTDTGGHLGVVGEGYTPIDNWSGSELLDLIVADGRGTIENVGYLRGGAKIFAQVKLGEWNIPGLAKLDSFRDFLTFTNSHDGTMVATFGPTSVRIVCENTHLFANRESGKRGARVKHTRNSSNKLEAAKAQIIGIMEQFGRYREDMTVMAATKFSLPEMTQVAYRVMGEESPETASTQSDNTVRDLLTRAESGIGNRPVAGTAFSLYNAVTEYVNHGGMNTRERGIEPREALLAESRMFGTGKRLMDNARTAIMDAISERTGGKAIVLVK